ncbi:MAG TPA: shikimate dehydrogenase [Candidatus Acidoferrales bacterium]|nr:shikimate dehydrogenase [Candidatus Acidoferrales bacterium]
MAVSGKTKVFGVIGDPVEHSLSPVMQNAAFASTKIDSTFLAFNVKSSDVGKAMVGVRALGIQGLNVTMPHKASVISFLDEVDSVAKALKAVNTVKNENGKLLGFNTDGVGALSAFRENGVEFKGKKVMLLGAGGAARAIAFALAEHAAEVSILNRSIVTAAQLADLIKETFDSKVFAYALSPLTVKGNLVDADILINATSVGMKPNDNETLVAPKWLKPDLAVMDIVYNPIETKLAKKAKAAGAKVVSGVEMLIYQGAASFEIWTGAKAPVEVMREAALSHLRKVQKS